MSQKSDFSPIPGRPYHLRPGLDLLLAPNPSPMTYLGTNTYLVGWDTVILIDPGPDSDEHLSSVIAAIDGRNVAHILVTHSHKDHSGLAPRLSELTCAPVSAFGDSYAGRSKVMNRLAEAGLVGGGEGVDFTFQPDIILRDGDQVKLERLQIDVLHTPGHMSNHLCFAWGRSVFTGDHVMGWASSLVSPPDGDLTDFMQSCGKLKSKGADMFYPGHGAPVAEPQERLDWLVDHRKTRETELLIRLADGPLSLRELTVKVYRDVPQLMLDAAERNVLAHLVDLFSRGRVIATPELGLNALFALR